MICRRVFTAYQHSPTYSYESKIAQRHLLTGCVPTRGKLLKYVLPNVFHADFISWKPVFSSSNIFIPSSGKSIFIRSNMLHSLTLVISLVNINLHIIKISFSSLPTHPLACYLYAYGWLRNPNSLGLERQLREVLPIFSCQLFKEEKLAIHTHGVIFSLI